MKDFPPYGWLEVLRWFDSNQTSEKTPEWRFFNTTERSTFPWELGVPKMNVWVQKTISLEAKKRGFHLITFEILDSLPELKEIQVGFLQVFILHTSASLTINENADPDVRQDLETAANQICSESTRFVHTCEGPDDMPAHVKASLFGSQLLIPIQQGGLLFGTWQGIYLCEHRNHGGARRLVLTIWGERSSGAVQSPRLT